jgi:hypothetical protein
VPATAEGVFRIVNRASSTLKEVRRDAIPTTRSIQDLGSSSEKTGRKMEQGMRQGSRAVSSMSRSGVADLEKMHAALKRIEKQRATATVDVDISKADAKIRALRAEIRKISTVQARAELQSLGLVAEDLTKTLGGASGGGGPGIGGVGGGGGAAKGLAGGFMAAGGRALFMPLPPSWRSPAPSPRSWARWAPPLEALARWASARWASSPRACCPSSRSPSRSTRS